MLCVRMVRGVRKFTNIYKYKFKMIISTLHVGIIVHMIYAHICVYARLINERPGVSFYCRLHIPKKGHETWILCTDQCLNKLRYSFKVKTPVCENKYKNLKVEELGELFSLHKSVKTKLIIIASKTIYTHTHTHPGNCEMSFVYFVEIDEFRSRSSVL